jgi:hypothetical protein
MPGDRHARVRGDVRHCQGMVHRRLDRHRPRSGAARAGSNVFTVFGPDGRTRPSRVFGAALSASLA